MAKVVNLKRARKQAAKRKSVLQASRNARKFGRTKAEVKAENLLKDRSARHLDGHFLGDE